MRRPRGLLAVGLLAALGVAGDARTPEGGPRLATADAAPLSARIVGYRIDASLAAASHTISGRETIRWRNTTRDTVSDLEFHLYMNAFESDDTLFMRESRGIHRRFAAEPQRLGRIVVSSIAQQLGQRRAPLRQEFPGPDRTVMRTLLADPVSPGGEAVIEIAFETKLPWVFARAGYAGSFHMAGQWFPKLGVYREGLGWHCKPYRFLTEFFADFGTYDVTVEIPGGWAFAATGVVADRREVGGRSIVRCRAADVHDFAWVTAPDLEESEHRVGAVTVRILAPDSSSRNVPRFVEAARRTLDDLGGTLGAYPYPVLTLVDPPRGAGGAGGMEYPTLVTLGSPRWSPRSSRFPELVAVHEVAHQYWYGMSANDETTEPWLDEGIASYHEIRILEDWFGREGSFLGNFLGLSVSAEALQRWSWLRHAEAAPILGDPADLPGMGAYGALAYAKPALVLRTLENLWGRNRVDGGLRALFARARFRHPTTADALDAFRTAGGAEMAETLSRLLSGTETVDYEVLDVVVPPADRAGPSSPAEALAPGYRIAPESRVTLARRGALALPVEVRLAFESGAPVLESWDGRETPRVFRYPGRRLRTVEIDPERKLVLELGRLNNGWTSERDPAAARRIASRIRRLAQGWFAAIAAVLG